MDKHIKNIGLKIGQTWEDGQGLRVLISTMTGDRLFPFGTKDGYSYRVDGRFIGGSVSAYDLVRLVDDATTQTSAEAGSVGDIHSTAKGSGARYNAGKPPFDLVPLQLMADYHAEVRGRESEAEYDPILALSLLGEFQSGGSSCDLLYLLVNLGDGWSECADVFGYGRKKYAAWNWSKGMAWSVPIACAARHLLAMIDGEELDDESGLPHRGHVFCNVAMLYTYFETFVEGDDRPPVGSLTLSSDDSSFDEDEDDDGEWMSVAEAFGTGPEPEPEPVLGGHNDSSEKLIAALTAACARMAR